MNAPYGTLTLPADANYAYPVTLPCTAPRGYHVTTCERCGEVTEPYSTYEPRIVHRATGWGMCSR